MKKGAEGIPSASFLLYRRALLPCMRLCRVPSDNKRLRDFTKIELQPGETKTVTFQLPAKALAFVGADGKWILEEGDFLLKVGNQQIGTACTKTKVWDTPNI